MSYFIERDPEEPCLIDKAIFMHIERMGVCPKDTAKKMLLRGDSALSIGEFTGLGQDLIRRMAKASV